MEKATYPIPEMTAAHGKLPFLVWSVLIATVVVFSVPGAMFGVKVQGLSWVVPLSIAFVVLAKNLRGVTFPVWIWIPWGSLLLGYLFLVEGELLDPRVIPLQRTVQLLCPLVIGMAASTFRPDGSMLHALDIWLRRLAILLFCLVLYKLSYFFVAGFGDYSGMAPQMMTIIILNGYLAAAHLLLGRTRDLLLWFVLLLLPVINVTRTATLVTLLTYPLSLAPMALTRRLVMLALIGLIGTAIFYAPRVQNKMFYSGSGEISDILSQDFNSSGRLYMWQEMFGAAQQEFWTGHGTGMGETLVYGFTKAAGYPHNDWLLTFFDYGLTGVVLFFLSNLVMMLHACRRGLSSEGHRVRLLFFSGASAVVSLLIMMLTDNAMVYAPYFGNLHYLILGLAYGAHMRERTHTNRNGN